MSSSQELLSTMDELPTSLSFAFHELSNMKKSLANSQLKSIKIIEIFDCPSALDALKSISNPFFDKLDNFTILKFKINEKLTNQHADKLRNFDLKTERNFLISYESSNQKIIFWMNSENIRRIKLIEEFSLELTDFVRDFLIEAVDVQIKAGSFDNLELTDLEDANGFNLLMKAIDDKSTAALVDELLKLPFDVNQKSKSESKLSSADIAWNEKQFQILLKLIMANSTYPSDFDSDELETDEASEEIKNIIEISNKVHAAIWNDDEKQIIEAMKQQPNLRFFYNHTNVSAAMTAINAKKYKMYEVLLENECSIGPEEDFNKIIEQMKEKKEKKKITKAHDNAAKELPEKHLLILVSNSFISHDNQFPKQRLKLIKEAYNILNDIPLTKQILKLASMHKNFKIHFDFNRSSVEFMNPSSGDKTTRGLFEYNALDNIYLYIGAKELLNDGNKFAVIGTLAHELCHFAMKLTFCNNSNPYGINDQVNEDKFENIIRLCKENKDDEIVQLVYNYPQKLWPSELIVRVPHMTAYYCKDLTKLNEVERKFKDLFDYYDYVADVMDETQKILEKLNDNTKKIKFSDLTDAYKAKIYHLKVNFQGRKMNFNEIIEKQNSNVFHKLNSDLIQRILIKCEVITIGREPKTDTEMYVEREFIDYNIDIKDDDQVMINMKNFDQISSIADETKMILLSDHAGVGKTTTFKHLSKMLKNKFANYWISYIDLKRHLKIYVKYEEPFQAIEVLQEILLLTEDFDISIFKNLYWDSKVILLFDGVDEIAPTYKKFFINLIEKVSKETNNQQWIATRPQHMRELEIAFDQVTFKLMPYNERKKIEFIENVLERSSDVNQTIHADDIFKVIENSIDDVNSPLMLRMMTELYLNDVRIVEKFNLYLLYNKMIDMKRRILKDRGEIVNEDRDNRKGKMTIWQVHQIYALKLLYPQGFEDLLAKYQKKTQTIDINEFNLLKRWKKEKSNWTPEAISRYGFLIVDNWESNDDEFPDFVHRTFAEFFFVQFALEDLYETDDDSMSDSEIELRMKLLIKIARDNVDESIQNFISSFIDTHKPKKMHQQFWKMINSADMIKLISEFSADSDDDVFVNLIQIFGVDERFLKDFKFVENRTVFQEFFMNKRNYNDNFKFLLDIVETYERSLGASWMNYVGYSLRENFVLAVDDELDNILNDECKFSNENYRINERSKRKRLVKLLHSIEQQKMPLNDVCNFFNNNYFKIFDSCFESSSASKKLMKIIEINFNEEKGEFLKIRDDELSHLGLFNNGSLMTNEYKQNVIDFCEKFDKFFRSDGKVNADDVDHYCLRIFTIFCGLDSLNELYEEEKFTKTAIQRYLLSISETFVSDVWLMPDENFLKQFVSFLKEIFDNCQMREFLETRNDCGHTALSCLEEKELEEDSPDKFKDMYMIFRDMLRELAKEIQMTDDEIEKLCNKI